MKIPHGRTPDASSVVQRLVRPVFTVLVAVLISSGIAPVAKGQNVEPMLHDFVGTNHPIAANWAQDFGIGWVRLTAGWMGIEARQGSFNWTDADRPIQTAEAGGAQVVLLLAYTPAWDQTIKSDGQAPPKNPQDWTHFVEAAVARYSAAPFNIKYFQVWNEPTQKATFWMGTDNQYIDMIYLPAAKIVRQHGGYVVFGGWPLSNSVQELDTVLNYHNAWQWTDYVDMHYRGIADLKHEYSEWVANGKCRGLWETEIGNNTDPEFTVGVYNQFLGWTLQVGWRDPNEFKFFWYASYASGAEGQKYLLLQTGTTFAPTKHGQNLMALNQALGGGPLKLFTQFTSQPATTPGSATVTGISVGSGRVVLQFVISRALMQSRHAFSASVSMPRPSKVTLMSGLGKTWDVPVQYSGGRAQVNAPMRADFDDCPACHWVFGYLIFDR